MDCWTSDHTPVIRTDYLPVTVPFTKVTDSTFCFLGTTLFPQVNTTLR